MHREYHLSFCKVCTNRKRNLKKGIICSLTNTIADFKANCPNFNRDNSEFEKYKKMFANEVNDKYATNNFEKLFTESSFVKPIKFKNSKFKSIDKTHNLNLKNSSAYDKASLVLISLTMLYVFYVNYSEIINLTVENSVLIGFAFMAIFISILIYRVYFMTHKTKIAITKNGIENKGYTLNWNNIVDYGILRGNSTSVNEHKVVIGTITKGIVEIDLTALNISPEEFINIIRLNTKDIL